MNFHFSVFCSVLLIRIQLCGDADVHANEHTKAERDVPNCESRARGVSIWTTILQLNCNADVAFERGRAVWIQVLQIGVKCWLCYNFIQTKLLTIYPILLPDKFHEYSSFSVFWVYLFFPKIFVAIKSCGVWIRFISIIQQQNGLQCNGKYTGQQYNIYIVSIWQRTTRVLK